MRSPAFLLLLPLVAGDGRPCAAAAGTCRTVSAVRSRDAVLAFVGERPDATEGLVAAAGGCGAGDPVVSTAITLSGTTWSAGRLPATPGLVLSHRGELLALRIGKASEGLVPYYYLVPLAGEIGRPGFKIERAENGMRHAVASLDDWTFALAEQAPTGELLVRRFTSAGPLREVEEEATASVGTVWPEGTVLMGADGDGDTLMLFGRDPGGSVRASTSDAGIAPVLDVAPEALAAGTWCDGAPLVFVGNGRRLSLHRLEGAAWREIGVRDLEPAEAIAAACAGEGRGRAVAFLARRDDVTAATFGGGAWDVQSLRLADARPTPEDAPDAKEDVETDVDPDGGPSARILVLAGIAAASLLGLTVLLVRRLRAGV